MKEEFSKALAAVLKFEGGKVNNPKDPGGKTNQGITQRTYDAYRAKHGQTKRDVYTMTDEERDDIYKSQYWDLVKGDDLPPGVGFAVFDGAVNSGVSQSAKWLQGALGALYKGKIDGIIGAGTLTAAQSVNDHDALILAMENRRMDFLKALSTWDEFKTGWTSRVKQVVATGQAWARGSVGPNIYYSPGMDTKAPLDEAKPLPYKAWVDAIIGGGAAVAAAATALQTQIDSIQQQLGPLMNGPLGASVPWLSTINHWLALGALGCSIVGGMYRYYITTYDAKLKEALDLHSGMLAPEERKP
jgi:lysozyme family protein